jgi:GxxExxY protein
MGAGYLEKVYEDCLCLELQEKGIAFSRQSQINLTYKGNVVSTDFRLDLIVDNQILLELKAVEKIHPVHEAQIYSYLKMTGLPLGFLVNFNVPLIKDGIRRFTPKVNLRNFVTSRSNTSEG